MTTIALTYPEGRISLAQRQALAVSLTDAVLGVECGQVLPAARVGFQVHFRPLPPDHMAIGGRLVSDAEADIMVVDVAVMDAAWTPAVRAAVIDNLFSALARDLGMTKPSPTWWIQFRTIDEGSWGSRGRVLSILELLDTGAFTAERAAEIRRQVTPSAGHDRVSP